MRPSCAPGLARLRIPGGSGLRGAGLGAAALLFACASAACGPPGPAALAVDGEDGSLLVVAGTFDRTCEEATSILFQCGRWELFVHLASPAQAAGPVPLDSPDAWAQSFVSDGRRDDSECSLWGDIYTKGTVEITALDPGSVAFTLAGTASGDFDADGAYDAERCGAP